MSIDHRATSTAYNNGCRCSECRAGRAESAREWRKRNPDSGKVQRDCDKCGKPFLAWPDTHRKGRVNRFCSTGCAGTTPGTGRRQMVTDRDHPLAPPDGRILYYRWLLFEQIGDGAHPCTWCGRTVTWTVGLRHGLKAADLVVDHVDHNSRNNTVSNLVPACNRCNVLRGLVRSWQAETGKTIADLWI
jgi:hypothetical protein